MIYKLILKRAGRFKKPVYAIVIVNTRNKFVFKLGFFNPYLCHNFKKFQLNVFLFFLYLLKGIKPSFFLLKILKIIFNNFNKKII